MFGSSYIEILNTSSLTSSGGVADLNLDDTSRLQLFGGEIGVIDFRDHSVADLRGGNINYIRSFQQVGWVGRDWVSPYIEIVCRNYDDSNPNWITGTWNVDNNHDGQWDTFSIQLLNQDGYSPVIDNIQFTTVPDPATFALLGLGGLLLCRKRSR